jgi:V8-like Glu-specific endopeptidase
VRRACLSLIALGVVAVGAAAPVAGAAQRVVHLDGAVGVHINRSAAEQRRVLRYWTPARVAAAKPIPLPRASRRAARRLARQARREAARSVPHRVSPPSARHRPPRGSAHRATATSSFNYYVTKIQHPSSPRYRKFGKVVAGRGRNAFVCSATVVFTESRSVVFTAGHCVHGGYGNSGHFFTDNWVFIPGFKHGARPLGAFVASSLWTTDGYWRNQNDNFDVGAAVLYRNGRRHTVVAAAGSVGIATGQKRRQMIHAFGYPAAPPYAGGDLFRCDSPWGGIDNSTRPYKGPPTSYIGCDQTGGSSGGGWIINSHGRYLNGLNSYGYDSEPDLTYGPYFGATIWRFYKLVSRQQP